MVPARQGAGVRGTTYEIGRGIECDFAAFADYEFIALAGGVYCFSGGFGLGDGGDAGGACDGGCVVVEGVRKEGFWEAKHLDYPWYTVVMPM